MVQKNFYKMMSQKMKMLVKKRKQMKKNYQTQYFIEVWKLSIKILIKYLKEKILILQDKLMVQVNKKKKF